MSQADAHVLEAIHAVEGIDDGLRLLVDQLAAIRSAYEGAAPVARLDGTYRIIARGLGKLRCETLDDLRTALPSPSLELAGVAPCTTHCMRVNSARSGA